MDEDGQEQEEGRDDPEIAEALGHFGGRQCCSWRERDCNHFMFLRLSNNVEKLWGGGETGS